MKIKVTAYGGLREIACEDLRAEAESHAADGHDIVCGSAVCVPEDGSGPMEGFFDETDGRGMVVWGDGGSSDWIDAADLRGLFGRYLADMD